MSIHEDAIQSTGTGSINLQLLSAVDIRLSTTGEVATFFSFSGFDDGAEHIAIRFGVFPIETTPLVRIHSECLTGDVFGSLRCDCGPQLSEAVLQLSKNGGYLLYLRQEGRGVGLNAKLAAYLLQDQGLDTYAANRALNLPADARDFGPAASMLKALKLRQIELLTNNPRKVDQMRKSGIDVSKVIPTGVFSCVHNVGYLTAKSRIGGHNIIL